MRVPTRPGGCYVADMEYAFIATNCAMVLGWMLTHALAVKAMRRLNSPSVTLLVGILAAPACVVIGAILAAQLIPQQDWLGGGAEGVGIWAIFGGGLSAIVGCIISASVVSRASGYRADDG